MDGILIAKAAPPPGKFKPHEEHDGEEEGHDEGEEDEGKAERLSHLQDFARAMGIKNPPDIEAACEALDAYFNASEEHEGYDEGEEHEGHEGHEGE